MSFFIPIAWRHQKFQTWITTNSSELPFFFFFLFLIIIFLFFTLKAHPWERLPSKNNTKGKKESQSQILSICYLIIFKRFLSHLFQTNCKLTRHYLVGTNNPMFSQIKKKKKRKKIALSSLQILPKLELDGLSRVRLMHQVSELVSYCLSASVTASALPWSRKMLVLILDLYKCEMRWIIHIHPQLQLTECCNINAMNEFLF